MALTFSTMQNDIFDWVKNGKGNAIINAVAGSGKTFTIVEACKSLSGKVLFLAFGKAIAEELKTKVPANVQASTLHSFGYASITAEYGPQKVVQDWQKYGAILDGLGLAEQKSWSWEVKSANRDKRAKVIKLLEMVRNNLLDIHDDATIAEKADHLNIDASPELLPIMRDCHLKAMSLTNTIDFTDMIYLPIVKKIRMPQYDWVLIDETQDLNPCQIEMVLKTVKKSGRVIAVGDPSQSIFGFRGADVDAMNRVQTALNAKELPLSVCYRCPTSHVELAQRLVPHIESAPEAIEGSIKHVKDTEFDAASLKDAVDTMILCRTNAPLTSFALSLLAKGIPCSIKGRNIGQGLKKLVNNLSGWNLSDLLDSLDEWQDKELAKASKKKNGAESAMDAIRDRADCIRAIANDCDSKKCITNKLDTLFSDDNVSKGIQLSSVHRAKGLEATTVYIIKPELLPLIRKEQKAWELEQEHNIEYVAYTRSKKDLVFVTTTKR